MKTPLNKRSSRAPTSASSRLVIQLALGLALLFPAGLRAQTVTELHAFGTNTMGLYPHARLLPGPDGMLYGTAEGGGRASDGQVFKVRPDGGGYTALKDFTGTEGASPTSGLTLSGSTLYGVTASGGTSNQGTVFKLNTDGSGFAVLKHFSGGSDGGFPDAELVVSGTTLYGTTYAGGSEQRGTVFKLNTDGSSFTVLKAFADADGTRPAGPVVLSSNTLYGTTCDGGSNWAGTVFSLSTDGTGYTILKQFSGPDGYSPAGALALDGGTLYGATRAGGTNGAGTVFKVNTDGSGFTVILDLGTSLQDADPESGLLLVGSTLYGTTAAGGSENVGVVFKVETNGANFAVMKDFTSGWYDCFYPYAGLVLAGTHLYGAAYEGGRYSFGALFQIATDGTDFATVLDFAGGDGIEPVGPLLLAGETCFGVTATGGAAANGLLFSLNTNGTDYTVLRDFTNYLEGSALAGGLVLADSTLYGVASYGGNYESGTLFALQTNGAGFTVLNHFDFTNGATPTSRLLLGGSSLYGTTTTGGAYGLGTLFSFQTNGDAFTALHHFDGTNGGVPSSSLVLVGSTLYGLTAPSGGQDEGTLFSLQTDGTGFTILKRFAFTDGSNPRGELILAGATLYGVANYGGTGYGTLFRIDTDGSGFTVLTTFDFPLNGGPPSGQLTLSGSTLYGSTDSGGAQGYGTLFCLQTNGTGFAILKYLDANTYYQAAVLPAGDSLYASAGYGGFFSSGLLYRLSPGPPVIATEPDDVTAYPHNDVQFSASAAGYPPPVCQWFSPTGCLPAQTNLTLLLTNVQFPEAGGYYMVVTNGYGSVTSRVAMLTVLDPFVATSPASTNINVGQTGSFSVVPGGTGPFTYTWRKDGQLLAGATDSTLALSQVHASDAGLYSVVVSNANGSAQSASAWLTVNLAVPDAFNPASDAWVTGLALQPDGRLLVGGPCWRQGAGECSYLARLEPDGTLDTNFQAVVNLQVVGLALQDDGRILYSTPSTDSAHPGQIIRLNPDGAPDPSFTPATVTAGTILPEPDGKILVGGSTLCLSGLARLNSDGSPDTSFNLSILGGYVFCLALQPDGKILVGGSFTQVNLQDQHVIARLNADGTLDASFGQVTDPTDWGCAYAVALQADGKILLGGYFAEPGLGSGPRLIRLNPDGTRDSSFSAQLDNSPQRLLLQPDGKVILAGYFTLLDGGAVPYLGRLNPDGSLDPTFAPEPNQPNINSLLFQPDGKLLVGGNFSVIAHQVRYGLARLEMLKPPQPGIWPLAQTAEAGCLVRFAVHDSGYPAPAFQWCFGTSALGAATNSTLYLPNVGSASAGLYSVVASNLVDCITSTPGCLSVIPPVEHRWVPGLVLSGAVGSALTVESADALDPAPDWVPRATLALTGSPQWWFDAAAPLPPQRFYRAWQDGPTSPAVLDLHPVPAITAPGVRGTSFRLDYINQVGPTDAWVTLDTITVTNTPQFYFDLSARGAPPELYRWVPVP